MASPLYHWEGRTLLLDTVVHRKRYIPLENGDRCFCPFDVRRWIMPPEDELMGGAWQRLSHAYRAALNSDQGRRRPGDIKAQIIWHYVVEHIQYLVEKEGEDFWQFPSETLRLKTGDCEDKAFLCASLLLAAGTPSHRVRVVVGVLVRRDGSGEGHAWPMFQADDGAWRILEPNFQHLPLRDAQSPDGWHVPRRRIAAKDAWLLPADLLASDRASEQYAPLICFNHRSVWTVEPIGEHRFDEQTCADPQSQSVLSRVFRWMPDWRQNPTFDQILAKIGKREDSGKSV